MNIKLSMFSNINDSIKASIRITIAFILIFVLFLTYLYINTNFYATMGPLGSKFKGTNNLYVGIILLIIILSACIAIQVPSNLINLIVYGMIIGLIIFSIINIIIFMIFKTKVNVLLLSTLFGTIFTMLISILTYMISNKFNLY